MLDFIEEKIDEGLSFTNILSALNKSNNLRMQDLKEIIFNGINLRKRKARYKEKVINFYKKHGKVPTLANLNLDKKYFKSILLISYRDFLLELEEDIQEAALAYYKQLIMRYYFQTNTFLVFSKSDNRKFNKATQMTYSEFKTKYFAFADEELSTVKIKLSNKEREYLIKVNKQINKSIRNLIFNLNEDDIAAIASINLHNEYRMTTSIMLSESEIKKLKKFDKSLPAAICKIISYQVDKKSEHPL